MSHTQHRACSVSVLVVSACEWMFGNSRCSKWSERDRRDIESAWPVQRKEVVRNFAPRRWLDLFASAVALRGAETNDKWLLCGRSWAHVPAEPRRSNSRQDGDKRTRYLCNSTVTSGADMEGCAYLIIGQQMMTKCITEQVCLQINYRVVFSPYTRHLDHFALRTSEHIVSDYIVPPPGSKEEI